MAVDLSKSLNEFQLLGIGFNAGSGAPTYSAKQGSLYVRTDGSSSSTRIYVNSDGGTTWVAVTTAS